MTNPNPEGKGKKKNGKKIADAGYRVLESLKELAKRPLSTQELLWLLEEKTDKIYRKEVINKYLNTLKLFNIELVKIKDKYHLERGIERIHFDEKDLALIQFLKKYVNSLHHETFRDTIFQALQILEKSFSNSTYDIINSGTVRAYRPKKPVTIKDENVKKYEKFCKDHQKTELMYKENETAPELHYVVLPLSVAYKKGRAFLVGYCYKSNSYKEFVVENITESKQLPQLSYAKSPGSVTFKLTGRLAKAYKIKKGETLIESDMKNREYVIISNKMEDKDLLLRRLIRYYDSCEILYPKSMREKMVSLVTEMENIYA